MFSKSFNINISAFNAILKFHGIKIDLEIENRIKEREN